MGNDWEKTTIGNFCPFKYGKGLPEKNRNTNGNVKVYGSNGAVGVHDQALVDGPGIIIGRKGTVGTVTFSPAPFWPIDTTYYVTVDSETRDLRYTYYLLKFLGLERMDADSAVPGLNRDAAHEKIIKVCPLPEQRAIAHILGSLDDKIELNLRMNATLEVIAQAIFKSWFVDFDPVRAKAEGRQPEGMDAETAALFPDEFEVVDGREVPKGWEISTIGEEVQVFGGSTPSTKNPEFWDNGFIPFATPKVMASLRSPVLLETERYITEAGLEEISSRLLPNGTVLLSSRAPIGYLAIAKTPVAVNQGIIAMICNKKLSNYYVLHWTRENMERIKANANGSTFQEISKKNFRPIKMIVPSPEIVKEHDKFQHAIYELITNNVQQSRTLAEIRDTLLPKLISGEIRVPINDEQIEEGITT